MYYVLSIRMNIYDTAHYEKQLGWWLLWEHGPGVLDRYASEVRVSYRLQVTSYELRVTSILLSNAASLFPLDCKVGSCYLRYFWGHTITFNYTAWWTYLASEQNSPGRLEFEVWSLKFEVWSLKSEVWSSKFRCLRSPCFYFHCIHLLMPTNITFSYAVRLLYLSRLSKIKQKV